MEYSETISCADAMDLYGSAGPWMRPGPVQRNTVMTLDLYAKNDSAGHLLGRRDRLILV